MLHAMSLCSFSAEFPTDPEGGGKVEAKGEGVEVGDGVLKGKKISVSPLFSAEDQVIAATVLRRHGGREEE